MAEEESTYNRDSLKIRSSSRSCFAWFAPLSFPGMAAFLKPIQKYNKELDIKNILTSAGLLVEGSDVGPRGESVEELFAEFQVRAIDLKTGEFVESVDVATYDPIKAAKDPSISVALSADEDIATLRRLENTSLAYIKIENGVLDKLVIPVRGYGLWGTLYGYLALEGNLQTISGLGFYQHKETPGLGGEVDNSKGRRAGRAYLFSHREPSVRLVKQRSTPRFY